MGSAVGSSAGAMISVGAAIACVGASRVGCGGAKGVALGARETLGCAGGAVAAWGAHAAKRTASRLKLRMRRVFIVISFVAQKVYSINSLPKD